MKRHSLDPHLNYIKEDKSPALGNNPEILLRLDKSVPHWNYTHTHTGGYTHAQTFNTLAFAFSARLCQMRYKTAEEMVCCVSGLIMAHTLYVDGSTSHNLSFSHLHILRYQHWAATSISVLLHWGTFVQLSVKPLHLHIIDSQWRLITRPCFPSYSRRTNSSLVWRQAFLSCWRMLHFFSIHRLNHMLLVYSLWDWTNKLTIPKAARHVNNVF